MEKWLLPIIVAGFGACVALLGMVVFQNWTQQRGLNFTDDGGFSVAYEPTEPNGYSWKKHFLFIELSRKTQKELYTLKAAGDDLCWMTHMVDCKSLPPSMARTVVDAVLDRAQKKETAIIARENNAIAERSTFIAIGGLIVAMFSMIISFFALKKRSA